MDGRTRGWDGIQVEETVYKTLGLKELDMFEELKGDHCGCRSRGWDLGGESWCETTLEGQADSKPCGAVRVWICPKSNGKPLDFKTRGCLTGFTTWKDHCGYSVETSWKKARVVQS